MLLYLLNRSGNCTSSASTADYLDRAAVLCRRGGNEYLGVFFRAVETFRYPLRC